MIVGHVIVGAWVSTTFSTAAPLTDRSSSVARYNRVAAFNHLVPDSSLVGYFVATPARYDVTVFNARAGDEERAVLPTRMFLQIAAGGHSEVDATRPDAALAIACTGDADSLKIAPQIGGPRAAPLLSLTAFCKPACSRF